MADISKYLGSWLIVLNKELPLPSPAFLTASGIEVPSSTSLFIIKSFSSMVDESKGIRLPTIRYHTSL